MTKMFKSQYPSQQEIQNILNYNPETGIFAWKHRNDMRAQWNSKHAGKLAGALNTDGAVQIKINSILYLAHKLAWIYMYGYCPLVQVDHKDVNPGNNRISNLRLATHSENKCNRRKTIKNKTGYKGVYSYKETGRFCVAITKEKKQKWLGIYDTPEEAYAAYCEAAKEYHGEFSRVA